MTPKTDVQRIRAAQVGFAMRAYRESFTSEAGRRGLTQEDLLQRMAAVDSEYGERFSHATVSRWESGVTRPTVHRLKAFGRSMNLSQTEVAGLILLAGLAPDFQTAWDQTTSSGVELAVSPAASQVPGPSEIFWRRRRWGNTPELLDRAQGRHPFAPPPMAPACCAHRGLRTSHGVAGAE